MENFAADEALGFLEKARLYGVTADLVLDDSFEMCLAEAAARTGQLDEGIKCYKRALELSADPVRRAQICVHLTTLYLADHQSKPVWKYFHRGLSELQMSIPKALPARLGSLCSRHVVAATLTQIFPSLFRLPKGPKRESYKIVARLCHVTQFASYFEMKVLVWGELALRSLYYANRLGPSPEMVTVYATFGTALATVRLRGLSRRYIDRALQVARGLGDPPTLAKAMVFKYLYMSSSDIFSQASFREIIDNHGRLMDPADYFSVISCYIFDCNLRGFTREGYKEVQTLVNRGKQTRFGTGTLEHHPGLSFHLPILPRLGKTLASVHPFCEAMARLLELHPDNLYHWGLYYLGLSWYHLEQGSEGEEAEVALNHFFRKSPSPLLMVFHFKVMFLIRAHIRLLRLNRSGPEGRAAALSSFKEALTPYRWLIDGPTARAHYFVFQAALARHEGNPRRAHRNLRVAERAAEKLVSPWALFSCSPGTGAALSRTGGV